MNIFLALILSLALHDQCGCATQPVIEQHLDGTWVGAISPDESAGVLGFNFRTDGTVTFDGGTD